MDEGFRQMNKSLEELKGNVKSLEELKGNVGRLEAAFERQEKLLEKVATMVVQEHELT